MFRKIQWIALCFAVSVASTQFAHAQYWVGASGSIDPVSVSKATVTNGSVYVKSSSTGTNTIVVRFDIQPTGPNAKPLHQPDGSSGVRELGVRYIDDGSNARVVVKVRKQDRFTGAINTLCTWDSDARPQAAGFQLSGGCELFEDFDWNLDSTQYSRHYYWLEATLTQAPGGKAALGGLDLTYDIP